MNIELYTKKCLTCEILLQASDNDEKGTNNSFIGYKLGHVSPYMFHDNFHINETTGEFSTQNTVDYEDFNVTSDGKIHVEVIAFDMGKPQLSGSSTIIVRVIVSMCV